MFLKKAHIIHVFVLLYINKGNICPELDQLNYCEGCMFSGFRNGNATDELG